MQLWLKTTNNHCRQGLAAWALAIFVLSQTLSVSALTSIDQSLSSIENKLFEHDYPKDDDKARLSRIENFVFGTTGSGSDQERLNSLLKVIPETNSAEKTEQNTFNNQPQANQQNKANSKTRSNGTSLDSANNSQATKSAFQFSHYPRVTVLEQHLLGHTYENQGLGERLSRLEDKCFHKTSTNPDLNQRVESLESYAQRHDLYGDYNRTASSFTNNNQQSPQPNQQNIENMVIIMENKEFGHPFPKRGLQKRLSKLESKVYHHDNEKSDLSIVTRTDNLWSTLMANSTSASSAVNNKKQRNKNYSSQPLDNNLSDQYGASTTGAQSATSEASNNYSGSKTHHSWLHKVAQVGGTVAGATVKVMSATSGMGYGMGGYGMGYPMGGYGMGSYGMNGYPAGGYGMGYPMGGYGMNGYSTGYGMNSYRSSYW